MGQDLIVYLATWHPQKVISDQNFREKLAQNFSMLNDVV